MREVADLTPSLDWLVACSLKVKLFNYYFPYFRLLYPAQSGAKTGKACFNLPLQVIESTEKGCEAVQEGQARVVRVSQLNLVDLAGSERAKATGTYPSFLEIIHFPRNSPFQPET